MWVWHERSRQFQEVLSVYTGLLKTFLKLQCCQKSEQIQLLTALLREKEHEQTIRIDSASVNKSQNIPDSLRAHKRKTKKIKEEKENHSEWMCKIFEFRFEKKSIAFWVFWLEKRAVADQRVLWYFFVVGLIIIIPQWIVSVGVGKQ